MIASHLILQRSNHLVHLSRTCTRIVNTTPPELTKQPRIHQYAKLGKIRLTGFVTATAIAGSYLACDSFVDSFPLIAAASIGTFLCSSSAAGINQYLETPYDSQMKRTSVRPLIVGQVSPLETILFSMVTGISGTTLLAIFTNPLTATLGLFNLVLYAFVYTPMKRTNVANTWIGSIVGAIPPIMGSTAVLGHLGKRQLHQQYLVRDLTENHNNN